MGYSTVYDVKVRYSVDNRGGNAVGGLVKDTRTLTREAGRASGAFVRLGAVVAGTFGVRAAGKALLGFNSTVQDTKLQIAGMLALTKKTDLADARRERELQGGDGHRATLENAPVWIR